MLNGHGDDIHQFGGKIRANFSSNVHHKGTEKSLIAHLQDRLTKLDHYPEPNAESLSRLLKIHHNLENAEVVVTNGATEAFYLIAAMQRDARSTIFTPSFAEYEDACLSASHHIHFAPNTEVDELEFVAGEVVWLCNPNNPDGKVFGPTMLASLLTEFPDTLFVIDEAYIHFIRGVQSLIPLCEEHMNLIVVRSMTKRHAIPGLRLGYMVMNSAMVFEIEDLLMPWRINTFALEAGKFVMSNHRKEHFDLDAQIYESSYLQEEIAQIDGFEVIQSNTTFCLIKAPISAAVLKKFLLEEHGLLIRDASNFRGLTPFHFRVAAQDRKSNDLLLKGLKEAIL